MGSYLVACPVVDWRILGSYSLVLRVSVTLHSFNNPDRAVSIRPEIICVLHMMISEAISCGCCNQHSLDNQSQKGVPSARREHYSIPFVNSSGLWPQITSFTAQKKEVKSKFCIWKKKIGFRPNLCFVPLNTRRPTTISYRYRQIRSFQAHMCIVYFIFFSLKIIWYDRFKTCKSIKCFNTVKLHFVASVAVDTFSYVHIVCSVPLNCR